ncbi:hypothetical protein DIPPA_01050 [Diplonema papillatum]|nr:hypothetical protein DIPPA_01050 [Diplonema papillatum]
MPPKAAPALATKSADFAVPAIANDWPLDKFLAMLLPFLSKTKIGKGIQGKGEKDGKSPQVGSVDLVADGKKIKMKHPGRSVMTGDRYSVAVTTPPKDWDAQLASGQKALDDEQAEYEKRSEVITEQLRDINANITTEKVPKNSWMHKEGGERAKLSNRAENCIGDKFS